MIRYALNCSKGHTFEAWFRNAAAYDEQASAGEVACPSCGSRKVEKAIMAPAVAASRSRANNESRVIDAVRTARQALLRDADNVGDDFAAEARRIHYKESDERGIYGRATDEEAKALREEGVEFTPLPGLPEDAN